jgi:hypothetical protein
MGETAESDNWDEQGGTQSLIPKPIDVDALLRAWNYEELNRLIEVGTIQPLRDQDLYRWLQEHWFSVIDEELATRSEWVGPFDGEIGSPRTARDIATSEASDEVLMERAALQPKPKAIVSTPGLFSVTGL